jgi:hypothetical protein
MKKVATKKAAPKKASAKKGTAKKYKAGGKVKKYQPGGKTPFQEYLKNPGAVPSDTLLQIKYPEYTETMSQRPMPAKAKNPNNQGLLEKAFIATYGQDWREEIGRPAKGETYEQYRRRMGALKKGGTIKKPKPTKMKKGGTIKKKK